MALKSSARRTQPVRRSTSSPLVGAAVSLVTVPATLFPILLGAYMSMTMYSSTTSVVQTFTDTATVKSIIPPSVIKYFTDHEFQIIGLLFMCPTIYKVRKSPLMMLAIVSFVLFTPANSLLQYLAIGSLSFLYFSVRQPGLKLAIIAFIVLAYASMWLTLPLTSAPTITKDQFFSHRPKEHLFSVKTSEQGDQPPEEREKEADLGETDEGSYHNVPNIQYYSDCSKFTYVSRQGTAAISDYDKVSDFPDITSCPAVLVFETTPVTDKRGITTSVDGFTRYDEMMIPYSIAATNYIAKSDKHTSLHESFDVPRGSESRYRHNYHLLNNGTHYHLKTSAGMRDMTCDIFSVMGISDHKSVLVFGRSWLYSYQSSPVDRTPFAYPFASAFKEDINLHQIAAGYYWPAGTVLHVSSSPAVGDGKERTYHLVADVMCGGEKRNYHHVIFVKPQV